MGKGFQYQLFILIVLCLIVTFFIFFMVTSQQYDDVTVIFYTNQGSFPISCEMAEDIQEKRQGLLGVDDLPKNNGMLFIYETMQPLVFTMKEMKISLDIIFINENLTITQIVKADIDQEYIISNGPAQYVVEINQGLSDQYQIAIGTSVEIIYHND